MRPALLRFFAIVFYLICLFGSLAAQINTGLNGLVINLPCNQNCLTQAFQPFHIPHLKTTSDYTLTTIPYNPYQYVTAGGTEDPNIYNDDRYSNIFDLPFPFCFYDSLFTKVSVGSNGIITFDYGFANCPGVTAAWNIASPIPFNSGLLTCDGTATNYPRASIMGVFQDLDPRPGPTFPGTNSSPPDRKIEWRVEGNAPFRRFVVSYYKIGVYQQTTCGLNTPAIFQIVIYESTGVIDIFLENKTCSATSPNGSRAILGIQNWNRDKGLAAPNKNAQSWTSSNEGYRFVPSGPISRFVRCELQTLAGAVVVQGDTTTTTPGLLDVFFPNFCQTTPTDQYVIKTVYSTCDNSTTTEVAVYDTITVNKTTSLNASGTTTQTTCGVTGTGTASITVPAGVGTVPYTFTINPGGTTFTGTSPQQFTGLTAGSYTVNVTDASGGCASAVPITVTSTGVLNPTFTVTNTSCPGASNGSILVNPPNGTPPFTYSFMVSPPGSNNLFTGLAPGTYFISVFDAAGCQAQFVPVNVLQGASTVAGTATPAPTTCAGVNNGSITVTATSGSGPYEYSINNGVTWQTSNVFAGLAAGPYSVLIREAGICTSAPIPVVITAGSGLQATLTPTATSCTGATNGRIVVTMTSGSAPYTFVLDGTVTQTSGTNSTTFNNVSSGSHSVTITDANGCTTTTALTTTVAAGTGFMATFVPAPTGCAGASNGRIDITAQTPGTAPFNVTLNPGAITQTSATSLITFNNLAAGTYNAVITDANGCQFTLNNMTVTAGSGLIASATNSGTTCTGVSNGSISVTMGSGAAPFTAIMDGTVTQTSATNTISFVNVPAGAHSINITDANGCITTAPVTTTVAAGTGFSATFVPTPTGCAGASNGRLDITAQTPGTAPFNATLNPGAITQTSPTSLIAFNNLIAGTYTVLITDANGCQFTLNNMIVAAGNPLNASPVAASTSCNGAANGSINVTPPTNGTTPYLYSLNGGTPQVSPIFNGLIAGAYTINVTDAGGCSSGTLNATVNAGPSINVTPNKIDATCFGSATGSITATASANATGPVQYSLDNTTWQASPNFNGLAANSYTVYIRDAVGCSNSANIVVGQPTQLQATTSQQAVLCFSGSNGKIIVAATGGISPYSYSLDNVTFQPANIFTVTAGNYTVYVRDANGCSVPAITNVTVTEPALLTAATLTTNATCDGGSDGTITINPSGGVAPYQFAITGGAFQPANNFNVAPGTYDITVRDINGCTYPVNGVVVGLTNNLTYTAMVDPPAICESKSVQLQLTTNATAFTWNNGTSLSSSSVSNPVANPTASTLYTVIATLGRCTIQDDVFVPVIAAPIPDAGPPGDICYGKTYQLQGSGGSTYTWTPSDYLSSSAVSNPVVTPDKTTTYTLSVVDANGCASLVTDQVMVKVTPPIKVTTYPSDTVVYAGVQIPLLAVSAGTNYVWSSSLGTAGLNNPNIPNPIAIAPLIDGSIIKYDVKATTTAGCDGWGSVTIKVYKGPEIYVPNAFTPNGDGKNELFIPFPVGIKQLNYFRVFNRWGQMIYSTTTLNKGWDGKFGGVEQPNGVYVWMAQGVTMDNKVITKKGTVTLIR